MRRVMAPHAERMLEQNGELAGYPCGIQIWKFISICLVFLAAVGCWMAQTLSYAHFGSESVNGGGQ